jgi:hypothetical protein
MPYALIPEGFTLKKVTKAQMDAVNSKRKHDNVMTIFNNPEIIKQLIITIVGYYSVKAGQEALLDLKNLGVNITKEVENAYTEKRAVKGAPVGVSIENIVDYAIKKYSPFE